MGKLEQDVAKRERYGKLEKALLKSLMLAGVLSMALLAPNAFQVLDQLGGRKPKTSRKQGIEKATTRLKEKGLIEFEKTERGVFVRITRRGKLVLLRAGETGVKLREPKRWDKKWRLIIFDIPERKRKLREKIRQTIEHLNFYRLQNSVWVYPYDCEDFVTLLKADLRIGKDVLYIIADRIENDKALMQHFKL